MEYVVVFGSDHHNALGVIRSLGEKGIKSIFILSGTQDPNKTFTSKSKFVEHTYRGANIFELKVAIDSIKEILNEDKVIIYTTCDTAAKLIADYKSKYKSSDINTFTALYENLGIVDLMNKELMLDIAEKTGFLIPKSVNIELEKLEDHRSLDAYNIIYPCITKPNKSIEGTKEDIIICNDREELFTALRHIPNQRQNVLVQEYIAKDFEMSVLGLSTLNTNKVVVPGIIKKIREYPFNMGSSSYSVYMDCIGDFLDYSIVENFINKIKYKGLFSIEFLYSKGKLYFLEINLRNDGNGYIPTRCGFNLPYYWYCDIKGIPYVINKPYFKNHYFMIEANDIQYVLKRKINIFSWIKSIFNTHTFMMLSGNDFSPVYCKLKKYFRK